MITRCIGKATCRKTLSAGVFRISAMLQSTTLNSAAIVLIHVSYAEISIFMKLHLQAPDNLVTGRCACIKCLGVKEQQSGMRWRGHAAILTSVLLPFLHRNAHQCRYLRCTQFGQTSKLVLICCSSAQKFENGHKYVFFSLVSLTAFMITSL